MVLVQEIRQWWDIVQSLKAEPLSRSLRRRVEHWLLGKLGTATKATPAAGLEMASAALQAEAAFLRNPIPQDSLLQSLLVLAMAENLLAEREKNTEPGPRWSGAFSALGRRLAWDASRQLPNATTLFLEQTADLAHDSVLAPTLRQALLWLQAAQPLQALSLSRVPGLIVLDYLGHGLVIDVSVLIQHGARPRGSLGVQLRLASPVQSIAPAFAQAALDGVLLGALAHELLRSSKPWPKGGYSLPEQALRPDEQSLADLRADAPLCAASPLLRELCEQGASIEVGLGIGGADLRLDGHSLGLAVAVATACCLAGRSFGQAAPWDTALTGGLDAHGRLLAVGGLFFKADACSKAKLAALAGPAANQNALKELLEAMPSAQPLRLECPEHLLDALALQDKAKPAPATQPPAIRWRRRAVQFAAALTLWFTVTLSLFAIQNPPNSPIPIAPNFQAAPIMDWLSDNQAASLSPDGERACFVSNLRGPNELWVQRLNRQEEPAPIPATVPDGVAATLWSPDGKELAYIVPRTNLSEPSRIFLQPIGGGPTTRAIELDLMAPMLVRWIGTRLYIDDMDVLWSYDLATGKLQRRYSDPAIRMTRGYDILPDENTVVVAEDRGGQQDLWTVDLSSGETVQLTNDPAFEQLPRWADSQGKKLLYSAGTNDQEDLWEMLLPSKVQSPLTMNPNQEFLIDTAAARSRLLFWKKEEDARLYNLDMRSGREIQLTANALVDLWPTTSKLAGLTAFARSQLNSAHTTRYSNWQILLTENKFPSFRAPRLLTKNGTEPELSPDGRWLLFLKSNNPNDKPQLSSNPELWLFELATGKTHRLAKNFKIHGYFIFPQEPITRNMAWSADSTRAWFVENEGSKRQTLKFVDLSGNEPRIHALASSSPSEELSDPCPSPDGRTLGYVRWKKEPDSVFELHLLDPAEHTDRVLHSESLVAPARLSCLGWPRENTLLALSNGNANSESNSVGALYHIDTAGALLQTDPLTRFLPPTSTLDPESNTLYMTRLDENNSYNLYAFDLAARQWRKLTTNELPAVTYSKVALMGDGRLIYSRQSMHWSLWLAEIE